MEILSRLFGRRGGNGQVPASPSRYAPGADTVRLKGAYSALGYHAVRVATREGRLGTAASGDAHAKYDRLKLLDLSREFFRDNAIYGGMISKAAENIAGSGFGLQAKTGSPEWNSQAESIWRGWWNEQSPEIKGLQSGPAVEEMVARELLLCGDVGAIKTDRGLLQLIEAEQIRGPGLMDDGIVKDSVGAPEQFYVAPYLSQISGAPSVSSAKKVGRADFLFIVKPERPSSIRGVPPAQAAFSMLHRVNDVCDAEALAWQLLSRMAVSITRAGGANLAYQETEDDDTKDQTADLASRVHYVDGGLIFHGEPGEEVKGIDRNIPGKDFTASLTTFLRLLGLPLGLPLEFILLDWTKSNYSQARAILEQAHASFAKWQALLEFGFHRPAYAWRISRAITAGELKPREDWNAHEWIKPRFPWIDQLKEAQAMGTQIERSFATQAQVLKSQGLDREEVLTQRETEVQDAIERAKKIEKKTGEKVPWQIFAGLPVSVSPAAAPQPGDDKEENESDREEKKDDKGASQVVRLKTEHVHRIEIPPPNVAVTNEIKVPPSQVTVQPADILVPPPTINVQPSEVAIENQVHPAPVNPTPITVESKPNIFLPQRKKKGPMKICRDKEGGYKIEELEEGD
jgi:lambda family phage portal protein